MFKSYRFYSRPSFLSGAARLVDLGGTFDRYQTSRSENEADKRALADDWKVTGSTLHDALQRIAFELRLPR